MPPGCGVVASVVNCPTLPLQHIGSGDTLCPQVDCLVSVYGPNQSFVLQYLQETVQEKALRLSQIHEEVSN